MVEASGKYAADVSEAVQAARRVARFNDEQMREFGETFSKLQAENIRAQGIGCGVASGGETLRADVNGCPPQPHSVDQCAKSIETEEHARSFGMRRAEMMRKQAAQLTAQSDRLYLEARGLMELVNALPHEFASVPNRMLKRLIERS